MVMVQVLCIAFLSIPILIQKIYAELTVDQVRSSQRLQIENVFAAMVVVVAL
ncbi:unnamed protein product, partial [Rotaria magnacalcarata]